MVRRFGIDLNPPLEERPDTCPCGSGDIPNQPHHDHVLDAAEKALKDALGESWPKWIKSQRAHQFLKTLFREKTGRNDPVVRFNSAWTCKKCNPKDGNGKPQRRELRPDDWIVEFYSMTPEEIYSLPDREAWNSLYQAHNASLSFRVRRAQKLAKDEATSWLDASGLY